MMRLFCNLRIPSNRNDILRLPLFLFFVLFSLVNTKAQADIQPLVPKQPIEKTIKTKEKHIFSLSLQSNRFVQIILRQRGVDLQMVLLDENGQRLIERDNGSTAATDERMSFITKTAGNYSLEISPDSSNTGGRYEISINELRTARPEDELIVKAENIWMQGHNTSGNILAEARRNSIEKYKEAFALFLKAGDKLSACDVIRYLGQEYNLLGERQKAMEVYEQALSLQREIKDRAGEASTLNRLCNTYMLVNENHKALETCNLSLKIQRELKTVSIETVGIYQTIGLLYLSLGNQTNAIDYYQQCYKAAREMGARFIEVRALNDIGEAYAVSGRYEEALSYFQKSIQSQQEYFGSVRVRRTLILLGNVYAKLGQREKALLHLNRALEQERRLESIGLKAFALSSLGEVYYETGDYQKAIEHFREALTFKIAVSSRSGEAEARYWIARIERKQNNLKNSINEIEKAVELIESIREDIAGDELRSSYFVTVERYYDFYLDLLWQLNQQQPKAGYDIKALQVSERVNARGLVELLKESQTDIRQGVPKELLERERALQQQLNARASAQIRLLSGKHTPEQAEAIAKELQEILTAYTEIKAQICAASPRYAALTQPVALTLAEIQQTLDADTLLLEYKLGKERSFLWVVTQKSFAAYELPKREEIETQARRVYELLTARNKFPSTETNAQRQSRLAKAENEYETASAKLSQMLFTPIAPQLKNQRLLIVGDGALQYIPFAALPSPKPSSKFQVPSSKSATQSVVRLNIQNLELGTWNLELLIENHEIVRLPSASLIAVLRREIATRPSPKKTVAIFADPVFTKEDVRLSLKKKEPLIPTQKRLRDFEVLNKTIYFRSDDETKKDEQVDISRLPFSRREAIAIQTVAPPDETFVALDFKANRTTAISPELSQYRIIHFATHGWLDSRYPELSSLILSLVNERGEAQNGFLRLNEIYNLELNADLVVLSACQTALGKEMRGEGLIGLTRGFMYAGAARVAASLWKVDDAATAELMSRFYHFMLKEKMSPPTALRAAQLELLKQRRWNAPYFWAAFVLQGEWH